MLNVFLHEYRTGRELNEPGFLLKATGGVPHGFVQQEHCACAGCIAQRLYTVFQRCREQSNDGSGMRIDVAAETAADKELLHILGRDAPFLQHGENTGTDGSFGQLYLSDIFLREKYAAVPDEDAVLFGAVGSFHREI